MMFPMGNRKQSGTHDEETVDSDVEVAAKEKPDLSHHALIAVTGVLTAISMLLSVLPAGDSMHPHDTTVNSGIISAPSRNRPRPLVIGHRGDSAVEPENSMGSFMSAARNGADYSEMDVRLTKDGVPVIFHDDAVKRLSDDGDMRAVGDMDSVDFLHEPMREHGRKYKAPTLRRTLATVMATDHMGVLLDLKTSGPGGALELSRKVVRAVSPYGDTGRIMVMSVSNKAIRGVHALAPNLITGKCISPSGRGLWTWPRGTRFVVSNVRTLEPSSVEMVHHRHMKLYVGVGDDVADVPKLLSSGVDGVLGENVRALERSVDMWSDWNHLKQYLIDDSDGETETASYSIGGDGGDDDGSIDDVVVRSV